jgi:pimeloyl-ACP methyl ester carboxylesterase
MSPIFDRLRRDRPVYALDLPGFGFSERSDRIYSPLLYQSALADFLQNVVGKPADIVALSLSCEFAALTAVHNPELVRSLVMISPTGFQLPRTTSLAESAKKRDQKDTLYSLLAVGLWNQPFYDLVSSRPSIKFFLEKSFEGLVPARMVDYAYLTSHQPGSQFAPTHFLSGKLFTSNVRKNVYDIVQQPTLVIYDRDPYTNFEMLPLTLRENENWQGVRVSPTKGMPHWEEPQKTINAMRTFWEAL